MLVRCRLLLLLLACVLVGALMTAAQPAGEKPEGVDLVWGAKISMRDGVELNATVYKPKGMTEPLPVVFTLTPYISDTYHPRAYYFAHNGYVFVLVDVRGRGNSGGAFAPPPTRDGTATTSWNGRRGSSWEHPGVVHGINDC